jgi:transcriptional regulator with XRE-family HTH domain
MNNHHDVQKIVGARIRELRKLRGLSQEEFGFECDLDRTYISGIERGTRNVSLRILYIIAAKLGVPLPRLFSDVRTNATADAKNQDVYVVNPRFAISPGFTVNTTM